MKTLGIRSGEGIRIDDLAAPALTSTFTPAPASIRTLEGFQRVINDDNSCIFNAVAHGCNPVEPIPAPSLRQLVAEVIRSDPERFSDVVLDMPREKYIHKVLDPNFWGGSTELIIMSEFFQIEIIIWNIETLTTIRYGDDKGYQRRIIIFYNGVHYDTFVRRWVEKPSHVSGPSASTGILSRNSSGTDAGTTAQKVNRVSSIHTLDQASSSGSTVPGAVSSSMAKSENPFKATGLAREDQTPFSVYDELAMVESRKIAQYLQLTHYHMNLRKDSVRCEDCGEIFAGQEAALAHAKATHHTKFQQV